MEIPNLLNHTGKEKFWSRAPGLIVDKNTGKYVGDANVSMTILEWYCTLASTINEMMSEVKNPKAINAGFVPFLILEHTPFFKPLMVDGKIVRDKGVLICSDKEIPLNKVPQLPEDMLYLVNEDGTYSTLRVLGIIEKEKSE